MRIKRMTATFGGLTEQRLELAPGLNLIQAPNESGKSTWAGFLKAMLYGIDTRDRDKKGHLADKNRYQTVYAKEEGSAAAPTAGLHFTPELLGRIREKGIDIVPVMLHVGLGTFRPVKEDDVRRHKMHSEFITVTEEAAQRINATRARGGRIIAVGTTSVRTLESAADEAGIVHPIAADTSIFIYPGYRFRAVDAMITNFHLPKSTLLMLISAFADRKTVLRTYEEAVRQEYRFFSFGDAMFIQ